MERMTEYEAAPYLMKMAISNINLNEQRIVQNLTDCLNMKKHLQFFDVSFTSLSPRLMAQVTD